MLAMRLPSPPEGHPTSSGSVKDNVSNSIQLSQNQVETTEQIKKPTHLLPIKN
jgi:hypothetical protein